jgi:hypothetical protein
VLEQAKTRALPVLNRVPDVMPAAQACCGVCRSCATTNIVTVGMAALAGVGLYVGRFVRRLAPRT